MALVGAAIYATVRFGLAKIVKKLTVHRGMFHSIPAALIAGTGRFAKLHAAWRDSLV